MERLSKVDTGNPWYPHLRKYLAFYLHNDNLQQIKSLDTLPVNISIGKRIAPTCSIFPELEI